MRNNDTAKLYQFFGGQASDYQELRSSNEAQAGKERWPLLSWLDVSEGPVPDAPKVQVGEGISKPVAPSAPVAPVVPAQAPAPAAPGSALQQMFARLAQLQTPSTAATAPLQALAPTPEPMSARSPLWTQLSKL